MATSILDIRKRSYYLRAGLLELDEDNRVNDPDKGILYRLVLAEPTKREGRKTKYGWRKIEREVIENSLGLR